MRWPTAAIRPSVNTRSLRRLSLQELMVDFFGSLVPGVIFLTASALLFSAALTYYFDNVDREFFLETFPRVVASFQIELLLAFLMLAYVIGFLFFRQDPKDPDRRSFRRLKNEMERKLRPYDRKIRALEPPVLPNEPTLPEIARHRLGALLTQFYQLRDTLLTKTKLSRRDKRDLSELRAQREESDDLRHWVVEQEGKCEFPYPRLRSYLERRRLDHLASMVSWDADGAGGVKSSYRRSKNYINILKIRLAYHHPEHSGQIVRNEAHVRLMSSSWYMSRAVLNLSLVVMVFNCARLLYRWLSGRPELAEVFNRDLHFLLIPAVVGMIAFWVKRSVEKFLHYQRVREVIFVLETAYTAFRSHPSDIEDICPEFSPWSPAPAATPPPPPRRPAPPDRGGRSTSPSKRSAAPGRAPAPDRRRGR